jgi:hypothetical protein
MLKPAVYRVKAGPYAMQPVLVLDAPHTSATSPAVNLQTSLITAALEDLQLNGLNHS